MNRTGSVVGRLRHRVTPLTLTTADDTEGGQTVTVTDGPAVWGHVEAVSSREQALLGSVQVVAPYRVTVRYDSTFTTTKRVRVRWPDNSTATFEIVGLRDLDGRRRWLELDCAEVI